MIFYDDIIPYNEERRLSFDKKLENWAKNVEKNFEEKNSYTTKFNYNFGNVFGVISVTPNYISVTQKTKTAEGEKVYFLKDISLITITNKNEKESLIELNFQSRTETLPVLLEPKKAEAILEIIKRNLNNASR